MKQSAAEILREYGPFPGVDHVHGVTFDGRHVWFAAGDKLNALDPASGKLLRSIDVAAHAGTAFDGRHLFQIAEDRIQKIDPKTGRVLATIPAPGGGGDSGLAWAEGTLWVAQYRDRKIHQIDPETGSIREREKSWSGSRCQPEPPCRVSSPTAAISSSAAAETAGRCGPSAGQAWLCRRQRRQDPRQSQGQVVVAAASRRD